MENKEKIDLVSPYKGFGGSMKKEILLDQRQMTYILINVLYVKLLFTFPRGVITNAGNAAWIQMLYVSLIAVVTYFITTRAYKKIGNKNVIQLAEELGYGQPGPTRYPGPSPESEPETQAIVKFIREHDFRLIIAYHSQGQVIYWNFQNLAPPVARTIGEMFSNVSGYALDETTGTAAYSGMKDWFIQEYRRPGYTIETGLGVNPLPISQIPQIYDENEELLLLAAVV